MNQIYLRLRFVGNSPALAIRGRLAGVAPRIRRRFAGAGVFAGVFSRGFFRRRFFRLFFSAGVFFSRRFVLPAFSFTFLEVRALICLFPKFPTFIYFSAM